MAVVLRMAAEAAMEYLYGAWTYADPRTAHLPMVRNPTWVLGVVAFYLYFVLSLGPRLMRDRKPFELRGVMIVYNAVQVLWCAYLISECLRLGWGWRYSFICEPLSMDMEKRDFDTGLGVWLYFILKLVDLLDTVFMVLRKNFRQISFLHVYHHAGMVICIWVGAKVYPGGHHTFLGFINCMVHCVMYSYYLACLLEPRTKAAWWKKYITLMQIVQFGLNFFHELIPLFMKDCNIDKRISGLLVVQTFFMFALFSDFYYKTYVVAKTQRPSRAHDKET